jgi:Ca2+-transporting ATPase
MVGDGINEAPAVKRAEVGVSVGSGTEVTKEAADIVLLNDSFSILISAVEEGRRALVNLRKIVLYLLSTGFSEIILLCSALAAGLPLPVLPAQILWANIVEEGFMNFAFAFEPSDKSNMKRKPSFFAGGGIFEKETGRLLFLVSFTTSMFLVALFVLLNNVFGYEIEKTRSIIFAAISVDSVFFAFSIKNLSKSIFSINIFSNIYLVVSVLISLVFLCGALFFRPLMDLLSVVSLNFYELLLVALIGVLNVAVIEFGKYYFIRRPAKIAG